jgi:hypothetical protein
MQHHSTPQRDVIGWLIATIAAGHLIWMVSTVGLRLEAALPDGLLIVGALWTPTRRIAALALPFWLIAVAYSNVLPRMLPSSNPIHVADLYQAELDWFGVGHGAERTIVPDLFRQRHWPVADLVFGLVYLCYLPEVVPFFLWLAWRDQRLLAKLMWTLLLVHLAGYATWIIWPAAPPWYVEQYGLGSALVDTVGSPAGIAQLDDLLGLGLAKAIYARNADVFGAMPSIHVASATVYACAATAMGRRCFAAATTFTCLVALGAIYFRHHYILDVLAGAAYGLTAYGAMSGLFWAFARCSGRVGRSPASPLPTVGRCESLKSA